MLEPRAIRRFRAHLDQASGDYWDHRTLVVIDPSLAKEALAFRPRDTFHDKALLGVGAADAKEARKAFRAFASTPSITPDQLTGVLLQNVQRMSAPDALVVSALDTFGRSVVGSTYPQIRSAAMRFVLAGINRHRLRARDTLRRQINLDFFALLTRFHDAWTEEPTSFAARISDIEGHRDERARLVGAALMSVSAPPGIAAAWLIREVGITPGTQDPETAKPEHLANEILRVRPPAWNHSRTVIQDSSLGPHTLRAGDEVLVPVGYLQTSDKWWVDALRFNPQRWESLNVRDSPCYFPFGVGPRACVGAHLGVEFIKAVYVATRMLNLKASVKEKGPWRVGPLYGPRDFAMTNDRAAHS